MRLGWTTKDGSVTYRAIKTIRVDGKNRTKVVRTFGSDRYICETYGVTDARAWAEEQVRLLREAEEKEEKFTTELCSDIDIPFGQKQCFNGGYLFLQAIYYQVGLHKICRAIAKKHNLEFDLNEILSCLLYTRILYPSDRRSGTGDFGRFLEPHSFTQSDRDRALSVLAEESEYIQSRLFRYRSAPSPGRTGRVYYDGTDFYYEDLSEKPDWEKERLALTELGLLSDEDGIPIAFGIISEDGGERDPAYPEETVKSLALSEDILCTNGDLSDAASRVFLDCDGEDADPAIVARLPFLDLGEQVERWALKPTGWRLSGDGSGKTYDLRRLDEERDRGNVYFKDRWFKEGYAGAGLHLIVPCRVGGPSTAGNRREKLLKRSAETGKRAERAAAPVDWEEEYWQEEDWEEEEWDEGLYAILTDLEDSPEEILQVYRRQRENRECLSAMEDISEAEPADAGRQVGMVAHQVLCFLSLILCRCLEHRLGGKYTAGRILETLREMDFVKLEGTGYQPVYMRTALTDALHDAFGFCTSKQIVPTGTMRKICADTKKQ